MEECDTEAQEKNDSTRAGLIDVSGCGAVCQFMAYRAAGTTCRVFWRTSFFALRHFLRDASIDKRFFACASSALIRASFCAVVFCEQKSESTGRLISGARALAFVCERAARRCRGKQSGRAARGAGVATQLVRAAADSAATAHRPTHARRSPGSSRIASGAPPSSVNNSGPDPSEAHTLAKTSGRSPSPGANWEQKTIDARVPRVRDRPPVAQSLSRSLSRNH